MRRRNFEYRQVTGGSAVLGGGDSQKDVPRGLTEDKMRRMTSFTGANTLLCRRRNVAWCGVCGCC